MSLPSSNTIHLDSPPSVLNRITPDHAKGLEKLKLFTVRDLLFHFPTRYADLTSVEEVGTLSRGQAVSIYGEMEKVEVKRSFRGHIPMTSAYVRDVSGRVRCVWFNQAYIGKMYADGTLVKVSGIIQEDSRGLFLSNPSIERASVIPERTDSLFATGVKDVSFLTPIYRETSGVSSLYLYTLIKKAVQSSVLDELIDPVPEHILKKLHLPKLKEAVLYIHFPKGEELTIAARKRFAFEEVFYMQIKNWREKAEAKHSLAYASDSDESRLNSFIRSFPFTPTQAQRDAITSISKDIIKSEPMGRLLEGDVGSGKTFVAACIANSVINTKSEDGRPLQVAYMAPTEILAKQHFESFISYFRDTSIEIGLLTGSGCKKYPSKLRDEPTDVSRAQLIKWLADGKVSIVIGTHALIQKSVSFAHLALIIIDEQHRFGVKQRKQLTQKGRGTDAEQKNTSVLLYEDLTYKIREALFKVKKELGSGHKEVIYEKALEEELGRMSVPFSRQASLPVFYKDKKVGDYRPDFIIDGKVILELKAIPFIGTQEKKQLWTYLKGSTYRLGILANFSRTELQIERVVYDEARSSAFVPRQSAKVPHLLSMTATPIPRTLALTMFGDLDLTVIDSQPKERKPILTEIVLASKRNETYEKVRLELQKGRQVYVICPRIDEQDEEEKQKRLLKSVKEEAKRLSEEIFPEFIVDIIHSKMKKDEKEEVMEDFLNKKSDILVATSVVEVGVNVPNATVIIIEHAERFGLAQLHQLRGRVGRAEHQSYCYLFTESHGESTRERLKALVHAKNGFELAELDMKQRGIGTLMDGKQWGLSDLAMEAIKNPKLVEIAREEAKKLVEEDPSLDGHPLLKEIVTVREDVHME